MRPIAVATLLILVGPMSAGAQDLPKRPHLESGADTNDAAAYYRFGTGTISSDPAKAADAFYWATRLTPGNADYLYARHVSALMAMSNDDLSDYVGRSKKVMQMPKFAEVDSLLLRAYSINPFLVRRFERVLLMREIEADVVHRNPGINRAELNDYLIQYSSKLRSIGPFAASEGRFAEALKSYAEAIALDKKHAYSMHAERGRIFFELGNPDSALAELRLAVDQMRNRDQKEVVYVYESKAVYEQSIAMIFEKEGKPDSAREAYGRALEEDLSYYPAHYRLSMLDLAKGDTAGALSELDLATQLATRSGTLRFTYAYALVRAGKDPEALEQLRQAVQLEPYYAAPYQLMGLIYDAHEQRTEAREAYAEYLSHASEHDPQLAWTKQRIGALPAATASATPPKP